MNPWRFGWNSWYSFFRRKRACDAMYLFFFEKRRAHKIHSFIYTFQGLDAVSCWYSLFCFWFVYIILFFLLKEAFSSIGLYFLFIYLVIFLFYDKNQNNFQCRLIFLISLLYVYFCVFIVQVKIWDPSIRGSELRATLKGHTRSSPRPPINSFFSLILLENKTYF